MKSGEKKEGPTALAVSADGKLLLAMGSLGENSPPKAGDVQLWDLDKQQRLHVWDNPSGAILPVAISPDRKVAAYYSYARWPRIVLVDSVNGKELRTLETKKERLDSLGFGLGFSPKGDLLVVASGKLIAGWDPTTGEERFVWTDDAEVRTMSGLFDDGKKLASGNRDGLVKVWDVATGKPIQTLTYGDKDKSPERVAVSPDGKTLVSNGLFGGLKVWDLVTGKDPKKFDIRTAMFYSLAFKSDNRTLIYNHHHDINMLDVESGATAQETNAHGTDFIQCLTITPDGSTLISGDNKGTIKVWDLK
jgi:WD40 repeat protein